MIRILSSKQPKLQTTAVMISRRSLSSLSSLAAITTNSNSYCSEYCSQQKQIEKCDHQRRRRLHSVPLLSFYYRPEQQGILNSKTQNVKSITSKNNRSFSTAAAVIADEHSDLHDTMNDDITSTTSKKYKNYQRRKIRNIAVIAHVDHGKTTLVDQLLKATTSNTDSISERLMDSGDLEKERGITITGKVTRLVVVPNNNNINNNNETIVINCADTPGHADFSGEVDRFLSLSDGFLLVVDAAEGPKTQTKYVLSRALKLGLKPIVVLNKCDRAEAASKIDSGETEHKLHLLFDLLRGGEDNNSHTEFVTLYASAREGWITDDPLQALELAEHGHDGFDQQYSMKHLLDYIIKEIPEPVVRCYYNDSIDGNDSSSEEERLKDADFFGNDKFSMAAVTVGNDIYLGRTCTGRILSGSVGVNDIVSVIRRKSQQDVADSTTASENDVSNNQQSRPSSTVSGIFIFEGINRVPLKEGARAYAGDVITLTGIPDSIAVGDTLTSSSNPVDEPIDTPPLAPPTLCMDFGANNGPLAGKEGQHVTSSKIRNRLLLETDNNVTLKVEPSPNDPEKTVVYARGELQLGILIEQMRREGYEMIISPPRILTRKCPDTGKILEPYEEVTIDVDSEYAGTVISALTGDRRGVLIEMSESSSAGSDGKTQLVLEVPSRGLLGFNPEIATATKGSAVVNHLFLEDREQTSLGMGLLKGKLIANDGGKATAYALNSISARGTLFIEPGEEVYSGMVIGETSKSGGDLEVNPIRAKEKTNIRTVAKDERIALPRPKRMPVEELIGYMESDEVIEVTPKSIRLRKLILDQGARERAARVKSKQIRAERESKNK